MNIELKYNYKKPNEHKFHIQKNVQLNLDKTIDIPKGNYYWPIKSNLYV